MSAFAIETDVGCEARRLRAEPIAGASEPADHLIGDEPDIVLGEDLAELLEIALGRNDHAARSHDRLGDEGGDRIRTLPLDQVLDLLHHAVGELLLRLARLAVAVVMRAGDMQHVGEWAGRNPCAPRAVR